MKARTYRAQTTFPDEVGFTAAAGDFMNLLVTTVRQIGLVDNEKVRHTKRLKLTQLG